MNSVESNNTAAVILAGGRSSRLGPGSKALARLAGVPMVQLVIERVRPQAEPLLLSVQDPDPSLEEFGLQCITDIVQRHRGPLTGLYSALRYEDGSEWLLLCPCDAPFVPLDLAERLHMAAGDSGKPVAVAACDGVVQPTFSLWNRSVTDQVGAAVMNEGQGGLMFMLDQIPHAIVEWPAEDVTPFFNVNTPGDLDRAEKLIAGFGPAN